MAPRASFLRWRVLIPSGPMAVDDLVNPIGSLLLCRQARMTAFMLMAADGIAV